MIFSANPVEDIEDFDNLLTDVDNGMPDPSPQKNFGVETLVNFEEPIFHGICLVVALIFGSVLRNAELGIRTFKKKGEIFRKYYTGVCDRKNYEKAIDWIMKEWRYLIEKKNMHALERGRKHVLKSKSKEQPGIVELLAKHYSVNVIVYTRERNWNEIAYFYPGIPFDTSKPFVCLLQTTSYQGSTKIGHISYIKVSKCPFYFMPNNLKRVLFLI